MFKPNHTRSGRMKKSQHAKELERIKINLFLKLVLTVAYKRVPDSCARRINY